MIKKIILLIIMCFLSERIFASPANLTYQGRILKSDGTPLEYGAVTFNFKIMDPSGQYVIYEELSNTIDMTNSGGVFDVPVGVGTKTYPDASTGDSNYSTNFSILDAFNNGSSFYCKGGMNPSCYVAHGNDNRILRVQFWDGVGWKSISPDSVIRSVPFAGFALSAQKLGNNVASDFVLKTGIPTCASGTYLSWDGANLNCSAVAGATGGTVTNVTGSAPISVATGTSTPVVSIAQANATTNGYLSSADWNSFNAKQSAGNYVTALTGDVSASGPGSAAATVAKLQGATLTITTPNAGEYLKYNGSAFVNSVLSASDLTGVLSPASIPSLDWSKITTGKPTSLSGYGITDSLVKNGGGVGMMSSGVDASKPASPATGDLFVATDTQKIYRYNGSSWDLVSSASGTGGTVTSITASTGLSGGTITGSGTIAIANTAVTPGSYGSATQVPSFTVNAQGQLTAAGNVTITGTSPGGTAGGDLGGTYPNPTVVKISGTALNINSLASSNYLKYDGTNWVNSAIAISDVTNLSTQLGNKIDASQMPANCASGQTLTFSSPSGTWACTNIAVNDSQITYAAKSANTVFAAPNGAAGAPTFRALVAADIPNLDWTKINSGKPTTLSGYGITDSLVKNGGGVGMMSSGVDASKPASPAAGDLFVATDTQKIYRYNGSSWDLVSSAGGSGGTITSVTAGTGLTGGGTSGAVTLNVNAGTAANQIVQLDVSAKLPAVDGSQLTNLQASQIPNISAAKITSGTLAVAQGGTGQSAYTDGQLLIGNTATSGLTKATLTAGSGVSITNGNGSITIAATNSGTVTNVTGTSPISVATGSSTPVVSIASGSAAGQTLRWDSTNWSATKLLYTDLVNATSSSPWPASTCTSGQAVTWSSVSDAFTCSTLAIATSQLTGTLAAAQMPAFTGDVTSSAGSTALTLANSGATAGTYKSVTVDAKGRVTAGTNPTTLSGFGITDAVANNGGTPGIQTGVDASKPASPSAGTIYFATDTNKIYQYNSGAWAVIASASGAGGTISALTSDVSASGSGSVAATVNAVGGSTAANVHAAELAANAATNSNTVSTIVKRDASGNFAASAITHTSSVFKDSGSNTVTLQAPTTVGTSYVLKFPTNVAASNGYVLSSDTSGNLSWVAQSVSAANISGVLPVANGGTNSSTALNNNRVMVSSGGAIVEASALTNGQILIGSTGAAPVAAALTAGSGISITNGAGSISIATTGAPPTGSASGDLSGSYPGPTVAKIQGTAVSSTSPTNGQFFKYNGTNWAGTSLGIADIKATITPFGGAFAAANCTASQSLYYQAATDTFVCQSVAVGDAQITYASKTANTFFAAPNGSAGAPTFRTIAASDLPANGYDSTYFKNGGNSFGGAATIGTSDGNTLGLKTNGTTRMTIDTSGSVGIGTATPASKLDVAGSIRVGTDATACAAGISGAIRYNGGNVEYCNGSAWAAFAASGAGITSLNGLTGNTQTFATPGTSGLAPNWSSSGSAHTLNIPLASASSVTAGLISKSDYDAFNTKLGTATSFSGDVSGTYNATSVDKIKGKAVSATAPTSGQFLVYDGATQYVPVSVSGDATMSNAGAVTLKNTGTAGTYTKVTTDAQGRVTSGTTLAAADIPGLDWTKITTGKPTTLSGYGITDGIQNVGGTPSVQSGLLASRPAFGTAGRLYIASDNNTLYRDTGAAWVAIGDGVGTGTVTAVTASAPLASSGGATPNITISQATTSTNGYLSSTDWNTFNGKQAAGNYVTALTGDVTASGPGSAAATIAANAITTGKILDGTILGADLNFTGVNTATSGIAVVDSTGKFFNFACATVGHIPTWTASGFACQAPTPLLPSLANGKIWVGDGTNAAVAQTMSGDATISNTGVATIANSAVTNAKMANMAATTLKGNVTGSAAAPTDVTIASLQGTTAATFAAGNDSRITGALQTSGGTMTGMLTLATGTTALSPLRIPSGTLVTTPVSGNIESDGASLYWTSSAPTRQKLASYTGTPANGQLLIGNGTGFSLANITGGSGVTVTNSAGGITIAATGGGGTVTSVSSANADIAVATGTTTPVLTLNSGTAGGAGDANKIAKLDGSGLLAANMLPNHDASKITTGVLPIARGGTNSSTALANNRMMASSGGAIVEAAAITANRALISDANGIATHSAVTNTELGYLSGVTSAVQTQLNGKVSATGWTNYSAMTVNGSGALTAVPGATSGSHLNWTVTGPAWTTATFPASTTANQLLYSSADNVVGGLATANNAVLTTNGSGVPSWSATSGDNFSQYALLAGRSGGQTLNGGTAASNNLTLDSTSNATKGYVLMNPTGGNVGIGLSSPLHTLGVQGTIASYAGMIMSYTTGGSGGTVKAFNNASTPTPGTGLGNFSMGDGNQVTSKIQSIATENHAVGTAYGTAMQFWTTANGSTTLAERMRIDSGGNVGIAMTSPQATLDIYGGVKATQASAGRYTGDEGVLIDYLPGSYGRIMQVTGAGSPRPLVFGTGGNENMRLDTSGNLGIGTTSPNATLDVSSGGIIGMQIGADNGSKLRTNNTDKYFRIVGTQYATGTTPLLVMGYGSTNTNNTVFIGGGSGASNAATQLTFYTAANQTTLTGTERMRIDSAGNVGVGTQTPAYKLSVYNSAANVVSNVESGGTGNAAYSRYAGLTSGAVARSYSTGMNISNGTGSYEIYDQTAGASRLFVDPSGNTGIGTTTPTAPLHVVGGNATSYATAFLVDTSAASGGATIQLGSNAIAGDEVRIGVNGYLRSENGNFSIDTTTGADLTFQITNVEKMHLTQTGRLGIGTASPSYTLHVNGSVAGTSAYNNLSDRRLKKDVVTLSESLQKILKIRGVSFNWRRSEYPDMNFDRDHDIGVIAQEVESVFPDAVTTGEDGFKTVAYSKLVAPLIESTKEIYGLCKMQDRRVAGVEREIASLKERVDRSEKENTILRNENKELRHEVEIIKKKLGL